jgi:LasA protease
MKPATARPTLWMILTAFLVILAAVMACARSAAPLEASSWRAPGQEAAGAVSAEVAQGAPLAIQTRAPGAPILTPTPDETHPLPTLRNEPAQYIVQPGDTLGEIARDYGISLERLVNENSLTNPNVLEIGQMLTVPVPTPMGSAPSFKIIPDSELVYGPASADFDIQAFVQRWNGYLAGYHEEIEERNVSGIETIQRVAQDYSVNPRLLLAVLEYQSGWVTQPEPDEATLDYPMGVMDPRREGLYRQLAWSANSLNRGFYLWRVNGIPAWVLMDGSVVPASPEINAGTAGVQQLFAALYDRANWERAVTQQGLFSTYFTLFGYPFDLAVEPLVPANLRQPAMQLPFEAGKAWSFTGGPHGAWDDGSAWGALDFAPPTDALGCIPSDEWVVAVADGTILRAGNGAVIQELDDDGLEQTGWVAFYMHLESRDRVQPGTRVKAGQRLGHPSCEGGVSSGTHVHLARKYNGEWIPADQTLPFILDGWVSRGTSEVYDGYLERNGVRIEAWEGRSPENAIQR